MWLFLSLLSAFFLGMYDVSKKHAVTGNAVFPVLFFSTTSGFLCTLPFLLISQFLPETAQKWHFYAGNQPAGDHLLIIAKSVIVGTSWILSYFGLKHLPITIASPLRATAPLFTVLFAVTLFGERPSVPQSIGIGLIICSYFLYSLSNRKSSSTKAPLIWILFMIFSAITGAISAGFDKYLLQSRALPPMFVLSWFLFYLAIIYGIISVIFWFPQRKKLTPFSLRPSIGLIGSLLVIADITYMNALSDPIAKLALVSAIRRSNVLISFIGGMVLFREGDFRKKIVPFAGIIAGLILIMA
ncbi:MAG TPA: EamA family transporter [Chitinispirillaceae bacterium]|nr:EamA family transporter [Chitinispirillaceae bacterium]